MEGRKRDERVEREMRRERAKNKRGEKVGSIKERVREGHLRHRLFHSDDIFLN